MSENTQATQLKASKIIELLDAGYTRLQKQRAEDAVDENGVGKSIQEYLAHVTGQKITAAAISQLFKHETLKGRKTKGFTRATSPKSMPFIFEDDVQESVSGESIANDAPQAPEPQMSQAEATSDFSFS